ncbi:type II secretion system protein GspD [Geobacter sp. FeAm09]|uniref:type II secretion system secretin GspD n=1 Tax=Geobacter sp. FeAm09 TaxID=2597769 RepID=UPI0011EC15DC|nr:type II secretion system secretin GspD [Geobacter sp. FeAm09]QEM70291.1 type II secretion system protein GspD [Geobacter sp. FeAm09]
MRTFCALLLAGVLYASPALATARGVVLNFNEVDISTMVKFISDLTGKNFVMDDRVKGKISVYSPTKLSIDEAYNVFTSVLELKGFTVVQSGKVLKIVPSASVKTSGFPLLPSGKRPPVNDSYIAQVIKLENISAQEALPFLQPLVSKDGSISAFGSSNLLVLDAAINLRKIQDILQIIDTAKTREGIEIIYLKNASAESAAKTIQQWLSGSESKAGGQPGAAAAAASGGQTSVLADQRLNALLVFGSDSIKQAVREMVAKLDVASPEASNKVNVYYLENTDATEMAKVLDGVIKGMSATATAGAGTGQTGAAAPQTSPFDSGKVTITADKASNSLVIMASPTDYNNLVQVIKKLDRRSKQVFVQVLIAEVSLSKSREVGMQLGTLGVSTISRYFGVAGYYDPFGVLSTIESATSSISSTSGLSNLSTPANIGAVLKALDGNGLVNVLSTPNILTSDNKEAEIVVGQNVPFQGSSTVSSGVTTTSVERKDVGITLKIKPQISEGDYIRMDLSQEISAIGSTVTVGSGTTDRITTKRSAKTNVVVKDNEMIVIGGLIQDQDDISESKVPFLGDIPGLGWLFKTKTKSKTKTNLMILLTPHIVKDNADLAAVSDSQRSKFGDAAKKVEPVDVQKEIGGK